MPVYSLIARTVPPNDSDLYLVQPTLHAGLGAFASVDLPPASPLLTSPQPVAHVIFRRFRREVCARCFAYDRGEAWKIRDAACGVVFCSAPCKQAWCGAQGPHARAAIAALEAFVQARNRKDAGRLKPEKRECGGSPGPSEPEIQMCWDAVEAQASLIRAARCAHTTKPSKPQKRALQDALQLPIDDDDLLPFLLSGLISHAHHPQLWAALLCLAPHPRPYDTRAELASAAHAYLQLLATLPPALLASVTPGVLHAVVARDAGNAFGIWSGAGDRDGDEFLGYGVWPSASFFNHSCRPSVTMGREGAGWVFHSLPLRVVEKGEELCISYLGLHGEMLPLVERRRKLKNGWGFDCMCARCTLEEQ